MTDNLHQRARAVFLELSTLDGSAASSELDRLVGDDTVLRAAVVSLLDARKDANDAGLMTGTTSSHQSAPITESAGTIIGPYKILQRIDEGGFGSVFLAEQAEPVRRRVALKIIKLGMDTKQVIARFEAERQALALMDHPHIARVFDAGSTDSGRPYFAMEYVVGDTITTFADAYKLDIESRLRLLSQICSAVQHAHTKGVIHRDLKPANVLVSMVDGKPFAKVIDFGIAKATASPLTHKTLFTEHRQLIGTPEYMSPEQADGSPDIDTRTDVYALGVLLYELLTGATPFDAARLRSAAWIEMQRIIREEEPPIPSIRLSRDVESLAKTAAARSIEPPKLSISISGEIDWIVMKALDKDRGRRYATPSELADDIEKHLCGDAVEAAPPSTMYRLRKFARRHKGPTLATAAVTAALLLGMLGTTGALLIAQHNAEAAFRNAKIAQDTQAEVEWSAYTANLALTQNAMDANDWPAAREYLAKCPESHRGWEWTFLNKQAQAVRWAYPEDQRVVKSPDGTVLLYFDSSNGNEVTFLRGSKDETRSGMPLPARLYNAAFSPRGVRVVTSGSVNRPDTSFLLDPVEQKIIASYTNVIGQVSPHSFRSDGTHFVLMHGDGTARVYAATDGELHLEIPFDTRNAEQPTQGEARFIPDGHTLLLAGHDRPVRKYDSYSGALIRTYATHTLEMRGLSISPDGSRFAVLQSTASTKWNIHCEVWDVANGTRLHAVDRPTEYHWDAWFDDNMNLVTSSSLIGDDYSDYPVYSTWDADTGSLIDRRATDREHWLSNEIDLEHAGASAVFLRDDQTSLHTLRAAAILESGGGKPIRGPAIILPDGSRLIERVAPRKLRMTETENDREVAVFDFEAAIEDLALTANGTQLVISLANGDIRLWDIRDAAGHQADARREWLAREDASSFVDELWDGPEPTGSLARALLDDASLPSTTRLVAAEMLNQRLNDLRVSVRNTMSRIEQGQTERSSVLAAANASDLESRAKEQILAKAEVWQYRPPKPSHEQAERESEWWEYTSHITAAAYDPQRAQSTLDQCPEHLRGWEWHYLSASSKSGERLLGRANSDVYDLAISPDGSLTANAYRGGRNEVQVRRTTTGEVVATLPAPGGSNSVAFSPDGNELLILGLGSAVSWNIATGTEAARLPIAEAASVRGAYSPDGTRILTYEWARRPEIWNATTGNLLAHIPLEMDGEKAKDGLGDAAFSADGSQVITAHFDHAKLWDSATGELQQTLHCEDEQARDIRVASDGKSILGYGFASEVVVWDTDSGEVRTKLALKGTRGAAEAQFSPAGDRIVTYGYGRGVRVWDSAAGTLLRDVSVKHPDGQHSAAFSPDGSRIVVWGVSSPALIDIESGEQLHELTGQHAMVSNAVFSPDGEAILTSSVDGTIRLWLPKSQNPITWRVFDGEQYDNFVTHLQFSHDGKHMLSAAGRQWREWHLASRSIVREHSDQPSEYFAGYGQHAVYVSNGNVLSWFDAAEVTDSPDSEDVKTLVPASPRSEKKGWEQLPSQPIRATSTSGDKVLTATRDGYKIVDANTGEILFEAEVPGSTHSEIAHQGDRVLSVVFEEAVVRVFDAANGERLYELPGQMARFDPTGRRILTLSRTNDGARIWDARSGQLVCSLEIPLDQWENQHTTKWRYWQIAHHLFDACEFSPDGTTIVLQREQREVGWAESESAFIYDTSTGTRVAELKARFSVFSRIAFSPDGTRIATAQFVDPDAGDQLRDSGIRLWNAESGLQILHLQVRTLDGYGICSVAWSPDGSKLAAGGHDGQVTIFDATQSLPIGDQ